MEVMWRIPVSLRISELPRISAPTMLLRGAEVLVTAAGKPGPLPAEGAAGRRSRRLSHCLLGRFHCTMDSCF